MALTITLLLAFAGFAIDIGRQVAERRHVQTAADAAALAACRALMTGASNDSAAAQARAIANANLGDSPANATPSIAADDARVYDDGHSGDPAYLRSGIFISGTDVRVAIHSELDALLARVVGIDTLETGARAHCRLKGGPALPIVAKRYSDPPGPGGNFVDALATEATSSTGAVDTRQRARVRRSNARLGGEPRSGVRVLRHRQQGQQRQVVPRVRRPRHPQLPVRQLPRLLRRR